MHSHHCSEQILLFFRIELHLIVDEAYNLTVYEQEEKFNSFFTFIKPDNPFVHITWGLSKNFSLPGLRVGALCSYNTGVYTIGKRLSLYSCSPCYIRDICSQIFIDNGKQIFSTFTKIFHNYDNYSESCKEFLKENRRRLKAAKDYFKNRLEEMGVSVCKDTISGFYVWADFSKVIDII